MIPTLQVNDRVQARFVSGSKTPQCLLGSNTLPAQQIIKEQYYLFIMY